MINKFDACLIVTFNSNLISLERQIANLLSFFDEVIIIDNSSDFPNQKAIAKVCLKTGATYLSSFGNVGIGSAQNRGLVYLSDKRARFVMFLDDDSVFPVFEISRLIGDFLEIRSKYPSVIGLGPTVVDIKSGQDLAFVWKKNLLKRADIQWEFTRAAFLVSSGSLYDFEILMREIGMLREDYFLDGVDMELGFRINQKGYELMVTKNSKMKHSLGDELVSKEENIFDYVHSDPTRNYYQIRNGILMLSDTRIEFQKTIGRFLQLLRQIQLFRRIQNNQYDALKMAGLGLIHGLLRKRGMLKE